MASASLSMMSPLNPYWFKHMKVSAHDIQSSHGTSETLLKEPYLHLYHSNSPYVAAAFLQRAKLIPVRLSSLHNKADSMQSATCAASIVAHQVVESPQQPLEQILATAGKKALGGGVPGMAAMVVQVCAFMWLRTTVNYQYRYGSSTTVALRTLYKEGGIRRFYRGLGPALLQGPLIRFGDTAANAGVLTLLGSYPQTRDLPVGVKTLAASAAAACFRVMLMPVDAIKTTLQVEGQKGLKLLMDKVKVGGLPVLYHGSLAALAASLVGHYPWFVTYNYLNAYLPKYDDTLAHRLMRSAFLGFCCSLVSDTVSNSVRVVKTTRQTASVPMTYKQVIQSIVEKDGVLGLMGRGLKTKIIANGLQGITFTICWRLGQDWWASYQKTHHV